VRAGSHTLRVEAEGTYPYQSDITLADGENRSADVPLEKVAAPRVPGAPAETSPGVELGLTGGPGIKLRGDRPWMTTLRLDVGVRAGWAVDFGLYAEYGLLDASGTCGTDAHGASPSSPLDLSVRNSFSSCWYAKAGLHLMVHFLPAHALDPWIAVEPGGRVTFYDFASYDPLAATTTRTTTKLPAFDVGARIGLDWHPARSFRPWAAGVYGGVVYTPVANENPATNAGNDDNAPPGVHNPGINPVQYWSVSFGLRTSLAF
jgi:hypothetical protein